MEFELDWLKKWNEFSPQSVAMVDADTNRKITYQEFLLLSQKMASVLRNHFQVQPTDRVAVISTNDLNYLILYFAIQRLGAILVPVNFRLTEREVTHILNDCQPKLIIIQPEFTNLISEFQRQNQNTQTCSLFGVNSLEALMLDQSDRITEFVSLASNPSMIIYTSGTTGAPKGAVLTLEGIFWNSINTSLRLNISQSDCAVIFLPFFHTGAWHVLTTPFLHRGARIILSKKFDPEQVLSLCEKHECSLLFGVPTTMDMMSQSARFQTINLSKLRYAIVGGEPMPLPLIEKWHSKNIPIRQGYGLTEFGPNVFSLNEEHALKKMGSIGFPNFYCQAKIMTETGAEANSNEVGELWLKGPMAMKGYWNNPIATQDTFHDGWLKTGDLAKKDSDGFFFIVGRKKEMYKSGGENVYPVEIEKVLRQYPGIKEVAVIGVPDEKWGEVGKAYLVLENPLTFRQDQLLEYCLLNLAKFKIPKHFQILQELPKGDSGKILKKALSGLVNKDSEKHN